jgi:enoyl-CoA hydratase/carnithine racemase
VHELPLVLDTLGASDDVQVIVLTGAGSAFSAGGNVRQMHERAGSFAGPTEAIADGYRRGIQRLIRSVVGVEVPILAAVNGPAIGAGCDLACMCDIRIASENAKFAESFVKLGIVPGDGGAWLLPRVIGMSKAAELTFTGDTINAQEALACGMVSRVVSPEQLLPEAQALAQKIAANPGPALRMAKRLMREGQHMRLDSLLEMSAAFQAMAHHTPEHDDALAAFLSQMK